MAYISIEGAIALILLAGISYIFGSVCYNLFLSPIAVFPGPKLAAASFLYEFYFDYFKNGTYIFEVERMHNVYGPIVRVNPYELSIKDSDFYDQLYVAGSRRRTDNWSHFAKGIDFDGSHFLTTAHDLHRQRRKPLEPFFSPLGVRKLEPMINQVIGLINGRFEGLKGKGTVIRLDHAFLAFSGDIISRLCCESHVDMVEDPKFAPHWFDLLHSVIFSIPLFTGFPSLINLISLIPERLVTWVDSRSRTFVTFKKMARTHIINAKRDKLEAKPLRDGKARTSLFHYIVNSDMPESELSVNRLAKEAQVLLGAGSASTARTIDFIVYYILAKEAIRTRLQEELQESMANYPQNIPSCSELEKLPYLQAIIKEGLRLSYGVMHRLPRCSPDTEIKYKQWTIPKNVPVGMSAYFMHTDPEIYPNPFIFDPDRWLGDINPLMKRNLVTFSRGSRSCLGMNLASAEINLLLATLFRPGGPTLELFETDETDVCHVHDFLLPVPKLDTKGVRVIIE